MYSHPSPLPQCIKATFKTFRVFELPLPLWSVCFVSKLSRYFIPGFASSFCSVTSGVFTWPRVSGRSALVPCAFLCGEPARENHSLFVPV